ncbi:MAG: HPF/RaiA family ribosome-associated protein [Bdellovibrionales bacterium]
MIHIKFKDLKPSELAKEIVLERLEPVLQRFPDFGQCRVSVTLSMENSPIQAGPDVFTVKLFCHNGRYRDVLIEKSAPSLYGALAEVVDHMLERLNRFGDRRRVKQRNIERKTRNRIYQEVLNEQNSA